MVARMSLHLSSAQLISSDGDEANGTLPQSRSPEPVWQRSIRYADQPMSVGTRLFGIGGVTIIALLIVLGALFTWRTYTAAPVSATLSVFDVAPPASPPEPPSDIPPGPEQIERETPQSVPEIPKIEPPLVQLRTDSSIVLPVPKPVPDPGPQVDRTTAPEAKPLPPAPRASNAKPTWEGMVLAALNEKKRYPRDAQFNRQQGVPYIRFVINREGHVLSSTLERSSGVRSLDEEAVALPKRAQPLPKPPDEVTGDPIELVVPVEYFLSVR